MLKRAALHGLLLFAASLASPLVAGAQAPPAIQYAYDELGRLVAVIDQDGNAAIYVYDAVGNILSIQRVDAAALPGPVAITALVPERGKPGTVVSVLGKGFGAGIAQNALTFNGVAAPVTRAAPNRLITVVPAGATTGPVAVVAPLGSAVSPRPFHVVGALAVAPSTVALGAGATQTFVATEGTAETSRVIWAVDGLAGGDPQVGTISPLGVFVAPLTNPVTRTVHVTATSQDDASVVGTAAVTLRPPVPTFLAAAGLGVRAAESAPRAFVAANVSAERPPDADAHTIVAPPLAIGPTARDGFSGAARVSLGREPLIASISPASAARGSANLTLTLTGAGLGGVLGVDVLLNNAADPAITVANPTAAPDGTQLTLQISIAVGAALGPRVVRVRTAAGTGTSLGAGSNVFTVQ